MCVCVCGVGTAIDIMYSVCGSVFMYMCVFMYVYVHVCIYKCMCMYVCFVFILCV